MIANFQKGYAPGSWSQVAVERTKPSGRIVGIDIIPAQPPKGVSTIQGNFLSIGVQEEVKKFVRDPNRGRPKLQLFASTTNEIEGLVGQEQSYIDLERHVDGDIDIGGGIGRGKRAQEEAEGKCVDVVLSDMSAPWEQTTGFWKRSLSDPYIRMMNTSGINFKDHAGSMVCSNLTFAIVDFISDIWWLGSVCSSSAVCAGDLEVWRTFCV